MKILFICLANSKKFRERCVAGVEVQKAGRGFNIIEEHGKPKWIRPVSSFQHGAVSSGLVGDINLLDIIEIDVEEFCPNGYQSENALFEQSSIKKVGNIRSSENKLDSLIDMSQPTLFGNKGKAVSEEVIDTVDHSLTLIKVSNFEINRRESDGQIRMEFEFNHVSYDLPITDIDFIAHYNKNEDLLKGSESIYLAISLGVNHNGWHSKLIAGVIYF